MKKFMSIALSILLAVMFVGSATLSTFATDNNATLTLKVKNKTEYTKTREVVKDETKEDISLILVIGQSNSTYIVGYKTELMDVSEGIVTEVSEVTATPEKGTVFSSARQTPITELNDSNDVSTRIENESFGGYSAALGKTWYEKTGQKVVLVQAAVGATCMHLWTKDQSGYTCACGRTEALYEKAVSAYQASYDALKENYNIVNTGYIWNQGENDEAYSGKSGVTINSASAYYDAYKSMHNNLMVDLPLDFGSIAVVRSDSRGDTAADSMYFTVAREAQYKLCNDIDNLCMASRIFETCDRNEDMQNTDNGSNGIHALQKTYNRVGADAAENILKFIGETDADKFTTVSLFNQAGNLVAKFNQNGELIEGGNIFITKQKLIVAVDTLGTKNTLSFVDENDVISEYGLISSTVFLNYNAVNLLCEVESDVETSPEIVTSSAALTTIKTTAKTTAKETAATTPIEEQYKCVSIADFEDASTGSYVAATWNSTISVTDNASFVNGGSYALKAVSQPYASVNSAIPFLTLKINEALLKDSYGFRFWVKGDEDIYKGVNLNYSVTIDGVTEKYITQTGASLNDVLTGRWITVKWGDVDLNGLKWYHNGNSSWENSVQSREVISALSSLTVNVTTAVTADNGTQTFYIDDIQMLYASDAEITTTQTSSDEETSATTSTTTTTSTTSTSTTTTTSVVGGEESEYKTMYDWETDTTGASIIQLYGYKKTAMSLVTATDHATYKNQVASSLVPTSTQALLIKGGYTPNTIVNKDYISIAMTDDFRQNGTELRIAFRAGRYKAGSNLIFTGVTVGGVAYFKEETATNYSYVWYNPVGKTYTTADGTASITITDENLTSIEAFNVTNVNEYDYECTTVDDIQYKIKSVGTTVPDEEVNITEAISTEDEASIRLNIVNGMRFYTTVDAEKLAALVGNEDYEIGTLIGPADKIGKELTAEDIGSNALKVAYTSAVFWQGNQYVGSIVNIKTSNYNREFVARGYIKVGDTYYYSKTTATRTVAALADAYIADATGGYSDLSESVKTLVDAWAKAND